MKKRTRDSKRKTAPKPIAAPKPGPTVHRINPNRPVVGQLVFEGTGHANSMVPVGTQTTDAAKTALEKAARTVDGFDNFVSRVGLNNDNSLSASFYAFDLMTRNRIQLEAAYRGSWVVGAVVDSIAEDMTRAGIIPTTNESKEDLKDLQSAISRFQIWQSLCDGIKWGRLYGGSLAVIQISGQDLETPLNLDTVAKGQFQGLAIYDRWQLNPVVSDIIKSGPEIGLPASYQIVTTPAEANGAVGPLNTQVGQQTVHHTRVIRFIGIKLPFFQAITEMMWGESVLERMWDRLIAFDNATMSSASLIDRANLRTVKIKDLREIIAAGGPAQAGLSAMFEMMRLMQVNEGLTLLDGEDEFASTAYSFAGLSDMMLQFGQQLSGSSQIPLVRLFGQAPSGLNSTGEGDIRLYYDSINAKQESTLRRPWEVLLKVLWRSTFGKPAPKDLEFTFAPLWQQPPETKANTAKTNTETVLGAMEAGVISRAVAMKELRQTSGESGLFSNISDEDIKAADEEEPPLPETDPEAASPALQEGKEEPKAEEPVKDKFMDANFKETDHPRKNDGKFGSGGGSGKQGKTSSKSAKPSPDEAAAIRNYSGSLSSQFIEADRGGDVSAEVKAKNEKLNQFLEKAPKFDGDIFRGIVVEKSDADAILAKYKEGSEVETDAKQSWTKSSKSVESRLTQVANEKKDPVKITFEYPKSKAGVDISEESRFPEEQEVIVPKGGSYKVGKVEKTKEGYRIVMEAKAETGDSGTASRFANWMKGKKA